MVIPVRSCDNGIMTFLMRKPIIMKWLINNIYAIALVIIFNAIWQRIPYKIIPSNFQRRVTYKKPKIIRIPFKVFIANTISSEELWCKL